MDCVREYLNNPALETRVKKANCNPKLMYFCFLNKGYDGVSLLFWVA